MEVIWIVFLIIILILLVVLIVKVIYFVEEVLVELKDKDLIVIYVIFVNWKWIFSYLE